MSAVPLVCAMISATVSENAVTWPRSLPMTSTCKGATFAEPNMPILLKLVFSPGMAAA